MDLPQWHNRPQTKQKGVLDQDAFLRVADQFISLANDRNKKILATELHFALMYAAARYTGHVGKNVVDIDEQDEWITHMTAQFQDMLRENMADPAL
jgi:hypothetical protein